MSDLVIVEMNNDELVGNVRTIYDKENDEFWFVAKDLAKQLEYRQVTDMYKLVDKKDKKEINPQSKSYQGLRSNGRSLEPNPNIFRMVVINESGLYSAIFGSRLPSAERFKDWVCEEVLPSIRKNGGYFLGQEEKTSEEILDSAVDLALSILNDSKQNNGSSIYGDTITMVE